MRRVVDEGAERPSQMMMMPLVRRGGGVYGTDLAEEWPSELPQLNDDLIGMATERAGARTRGMARYCGR
jgi:hypothetical protein